MARSQLRHNVVDRAGNAIVGALCYVYEQGTTTEATGVFEDLVGGVAVDSLVSNAQGEVVGYLDDPRLVDLKVTDNGGTAAYATRPGEGLTWSAFIETVEVGSTSSGASFGMVVATVAAPVDSDTSLWDPPELAAADVLLITALPLVPSAWQADHSYITGDYVRPSTPNGHTYRASMIGGTTGATEPDWPSGAGQSVSDGAMVWTNNLAFNRLGTADGLWHPLTVIPDVGYPRQNTIVANGHSWIGGFASGTTGATEPDWASAPNYLDTVTDAGLTWQNVGLGYIWSPFLHVGPTNEGGGGATMVPTAPADRTLIYGSYAFTLNGPGFSGGSEPTFPTSNGAHVDDYEVRWTEGDIVGQPATISGITAPTSQRAITVVNAGPERLKFAASGSTGPTEILDPGSDGPFNLIPGGSLGFAHTDDGWLVMLPYYG